MITSDGFPFSMKKLLCNILCAICLFFSLPTLLHAQSDSSRYAMKISGGGMVGYAIPHSASAKRVLSGDKILTGGSINLSWQAKGDSVSLSDDMFGRPTIGIGIDFSNYDNIPLHVVNPEELPGQEPSTMGQMITLLASAKRPLIRNSNVEAGAYLSQGIGICTKPYFRKSNPENLFVGARAALLVGLGFYGDVKVGKNWTVGASAILHHYSNGRFKHPNLGINSIDAGVHATYTLNPDTVAHNPYEWQRIKRERNIKYPKHWYVDASVSWMPRALVSEHYYYWYSTPEDHPRHRTGHFKLHHSIAVDAALMYRYGHKFASGLGIEYVYAPIGDDIERWETLRDFDTPYQDPHGFSIVAHHEAKYKNIGIHIGMGYYLKNEPQQFGDPKSPVFETAGLRYYLPVNNRSLYIGYNIRARVITADCFQFTLGYQLGKK